MSPAGAQIDLPRLRLALLFSTLVLEVLTANVGAATSSPSGGPGIEFTSIPPVGSFQLLAGRVANVPPASYQVAVFIDVFGWWTKPSWTAPLTAIHPDGTWTCNITTGGADQCATRIAAFLVPAGFNPPQLNGQSELPADLDQHAVAKALFDRVLQGPTLRFAGYDWTVKSTGACQWGPGPNYFSNSTSNALVDAQGRLHLRLTHRTDAWECAEVALPQSLGYGTYRFLLDSTADNFDPNVVVACFLWSDDPAFNHREIDIEFSKWSASANPNNAQFVVQPFDTPQHLQAFREPAGVMVSTHAFTWAPDQVSFQSWRGPAPSPVAPSELMRQWTFTNAAAIPPPGDATAHINLWLFNSVPPVNGQEVEVVVGDFQFSPATPVLTGAMTTAGLVVSWPSGFSDYTPETATAVSGPWSGLGTMPLLIENQLQLTLPISNNKTLFFRLRQ
jgi:hypothetical protein